MAIPDFVRKRPKLWYYVFLVIAVTVFFFISNLVMLASDRELVWFTDAQPLYANFLTWWVDAVRSFVAGIASGAPVEFPQFTYSLGYGADVSMTMGSYLQDPLNVIALAFPTDMIAVPYSIMTWLRVELAAVAFSEYCFSRGHGRKATAVAALAYATCGYILFWGMMRHTKYIDWAVLLPLILMGADKLFEKKSPVLLGVTLALQFFISIYTAYMSCLALLFYCLVKYFFAPRDRSLRDLVVLVLKFVAVVIVAFLVSALFSVPQVGSLLGQSRATSGAKTDLIFTVSYYAKIPSQLIGANVTTNSLVLGAVSTFSAIAFVVARKRLPRDVRRPWQVAMVLCVLGMLTPFVGHVFNGMGYSTDRWGLVIAFVFSYVICLIVPLLPELTRREWKRIGLVAGVFFLAVIAYAIFQIPTEGEWQAAVWPLTMTLLFAGAIVAIARVSARRNAVALSALLSFAVIVGAGATCLFYTAPIGGNWASTFSKNGTVASMIDGGGPAAPMDTIDDKDKVRFSYVRVYDGMKNSALTHGTMAVDFYSSFYNQKIDNFRQELGISDHYANFSFAGSDSRLAIDAITGVGYYVIKEGDEWRLPYSYESTGVSKGEYSVYSTSNRNPLAFATDKVISRDDYEALNMVEKQEALLQGVVLESEDIPEGYDQTQPSFGTKVIDYKVSDTHGAKIEDGVIHTKKKNATVTLDFAGLPNSETYVCFENLGASSFSPMETAELKGKNPSLSDYVYEFAYHEDKQYGIKATMNDRTRRFTYATERHVRSGGKKNWTLNMGYYEQAPTSITIKFDEIGTYTFDALQIVCQPIEPVIDKIDALSKGGLSDLQLSTNHMSASLDLGDSQRSIAAFMVANAPGWTVTVDGQKAEALDADTGFLAVAVEGQGRHEIDWRYENPYARTGGWLSLLGVVLAVIALIARKVLSRNRSL